MDDIINFNNVSIGYSTALLPPFSFSVKRGNITGIVGPNGAGKSTLVKTVVKTIKPISGNVDFNFKTIGYLPQKHFVNINFPLSAFQAATMGVENIKAYKSDLDKYKKNILSLFEKLNILSIKDKLFSSLSGGQQQKVLLIKALSVNPDILILDEPSNGVDIVSEHELYNFLVKINKERQLTILIVEHDISKVFKIANNFIIINKDKELFKTGLKNEIITSENLSLLYDKNIESQIVNGELLWHLTN